MIEILVGLGFISAVAFFAVRKFKKAGDPEKNKISKAKFSIAGAVCLLDKYDIIIKEY